MLGRTTTGVGVVAPVRALDRAYEREAAVFRAAIIASNAP
jgi:hypothetical protein